MTQPVAYTRVFDFTGYQASSPSTPLPGNQVDAELNAVKLTLTQVLANLAIIQRDDTLLGNNTVHPDAFTVASLALISGSAGWNPKGAWVTATGYVLKDFVSQGGANYVCVVPHTSGTFATDLAAGKWQAVLNISSANAILRDGTAAPTANIPWGSFKITGLADGTLAQDAVTIKQAQSNTLEWGGISTGAAGNFAVTLSPAPSAYVTGMVVRFQTHQANNAADPVVNVNGLGNKTIKKMGSTALVANDMPNGAIIEAEYDGTNFQILSLIGNTAVLGANTFTGLQTYNLGSSVLANVLISSLAGSALGPTLEIQRAITGGAANLIGTADFTGQSSTSVARTFARLQGKIITATNGAEDGEMEVWTTRGGTMANRLNVGAGLWTPGAAGGDKGTDSINASAVYIGGVAVNVNGAVSGQTLCVFNPLANEPPSANFATLGFRNSHPTLQFDTTTSWAAIFTAVMPQRYSNATGITVLVTWTAASATSGTGGWTAEVERMDSGTDLDSDSFASAQTITASAVPGTSGQPKTTSVAIAKGANMDSVVAGDTFRIRIKRDVANDNAAGNLEIMSVEIRET